MTTITLPSVSRPDQFVITSKSEPIKVLGITPEVIVQPGERVS